MIVIVLKVRNVDQPELGSTFQRGKRTPHPPVMMLPSLLALGVVFAAVRDVTSTGG